MSYKIFTIIVTYNGQKWISNTIRSVQGNSIHSEVIVVDNNSTDGTLEIIEQEFPKVQLIKLHSNLGFGKANNIGIKSALGQGADYIFLLNQDAHTDIDTIENLLSNFNIDSSIGIVSPVHLNGKGGDFDYGFKFYVTKYLPGIDKNILLNSKRLVICNFINAAAWMLSKECILTVGGFNPLYYHYGEDTDYINRLHYFKFDLAIQSGSFIYHDRPQHIDFSDVFKNAKREEIAFLKHLTNINLSKTKVFIEILDKLFREGIYYTITFQLKKLIGVIGGFFLVLKKFSMAFKFRRFSKKKGAYLD